MSVYRENLKSELNFYNDGVYQYEDIVEKLKIENEGYKDNFYFNIEVALAAQASAELFVILVNTIEKRIVEWIPNDSVDPFRDAIFKAVIFSAIISFNAIRAEKALSALSEWKSNNNTIKSIES